MVQSKTEFEKIKDRIIRGDAPAVIIVDDAETPLGLVVDEWLKEYADLLQESEILPVRIDCTRYADSLAIWKGLAGGIRQGLSGVYDDEVAQRKWSRVETQQNATETIKMNLVSVLDYVRKNSHWTVLLILEGFESVIEKMDEPDIMKIRNMTTSLRVLSVSHLPLEELGAAKYGNVYFLNQFLSYHIQ